MSPSLQQLIERMNRGETIVGDGAWATELQRAGLELGECPEEWNLSHPGTVRKIARDYIDAGADFVLTNSFGGNKFRLVRHGQADKMAQLNKLGAQLSREANPDGVVFGSVGPTGEFVQPEGMLTERELYEAFHEQMIALKEGGVDGICIETMYVTDEAVTAIRAAKSLGLFCLASMTFDSTPQGFRAMMGATIEQGAKAMDAAGADVVGTNCGNGIEEMVKIAREMRKFTNKPLIVRSNAGIPELIDDKPVYRETPQMMAAHVRELREIGVAIVGGCCGTTPEHVRAFRGALDS